VILWVETIEFMASSPEARGQGDAHKIRSFVQTVQSFAVAGNITPSDAQTLLGAAGDVVVSLG
jgi:hypothetical protein